MKKRMLLLVAVSILVLVVILTLFLYSTKPSLLKIELPDNVTISVLPDWSQTKSLGSKEEGRLITFQGKEIITTLTYFPLENANMTYGTTKLDEIVNVHLNVLEATYGKYKLEREEKTKINGHNAFAIKISYFVDNKAYISQQILWICTDSHRLFILSINAPKSVFENNEKTLKTIIDSITCH